MFSETECKVNTVDGIESTRMYTMKFSVMHLNTVMLLFRAPEMQDGINSNNTI